MEVNLLFILYMSLLSLLMEKAYCLVCKECQGDEPACLTVKDTKCETMGADYDTCVTFSGNFMGKDGKKHDGSVIRACGQSAKLQSMSTSVVKNQCTNVDQSKDATGSTFSGRFCLCSTDRCNAADASAGTMLTYSLLAMLTGVSVIGFVAL